MSVTPPDDALPLTALVPESAADPIMLLDQHAALCMGVVERDGAHLIGASWDAPGIYILLDPLREDGTWGSYVGKAPAGLRSRLQHHIRNKDHWSRALLVCRDTTHGFNSAQVGWLEGRLYDLLHAAELARLHNGNRPVDETLPQYERSMLESALLPISRALRLLGYDVASPDDAATVAPKRKGRFFGITLRQLLDAGFVVPGARLVSTNGSWPASAAVESDGQVSVAGVTYATPSAAAASVKGGAANGWDFWAVEGESGRVTLAVLRARLLEQG